MIENKKVEKLVYELLLALGENPEREGLKETPRRVSKMFSEFFEKDDLKDNLIKIFSEDFENSGIIEVKNISFCSLCEHHMLPFRGTVNVKYLPKKNFVIGLSKVARIVEYFSKGLQIQERIANKIADFMFSKFPIQGIEVQIEAEHLCMSIRGAKAIGSTTQTVAFRGNFNLKKETF